MRISNFDFGAIKIIKNKAIIEISKSELETETLDNLDSIRDTRNNFLELEEISENDKGKVVFTYELPNNLKPVSKIKKEQLIIKLSIAKQILIDDELNKTNEYVSVHPSTLFYRPMTNVNYAYRANQFMPQERKFSNFDRYKAVVLSIVSGVSYEICLKNKERLLKSKNEVVKQLMESESREELLKDLDDLLEYKQYSYFKNQEQNKKKTKVRRIIALSATFVILLLAIGITKSQSNNELETAEAYYQSQLEERDNAIQIQEHLSNEEYQEAAEVMQAAGREEEEIANMFIDAGLYQEAIELNPEFISPIVESFYENDNREAILELSLEDNEELETEQKIIDYDHNYLINQANFVENSDLALRIGMAFVDNNRVEDARILQQRIQNDDLAYYIELSDKQAELEDKNTEITNVENNLEDENDKRNPNDDDIADMESNLETLNSDRATIEQEIEKLEDSITKRWLLNGDSESQTD